MHRCLHSLIMMITMIIIMMIIPGSAVYPMELRYEDLIANKNGCNICHRLLSGVSQGMQRNISISLTPLDHNYKDASCLTCARILAQCRLVGTVQTGWHSSDWLAQFRLVGTVQTGWHSSDWLAQCGLISTVQID